jgi:hypothetical protein
MASSHGVDNLHLRQKDEKFQLQASKLFAVSAETASNTAP